MGRFQPVTSAMGSRIGRFALPGDNLGFCSAILRKHNSAAVSPLQLESLRYTRPAPAQQGEAAPRQPVVVNLLMQLRAYCDQSNTFLRSQTALNLQLTQQLRQVLSASNGAVRAQAGEIERAVRQNLYRDGEFRRAMDSLARELKKNDNRTPELTAGLPGPAAAASRALGRSVPAPPAAAGRRQQEAPVLRASVFQSQPGPGPVLAAPAGREGDGMLRLALPQPQGSGAPPEKAAPVGRRGKTASPAGAGEETREAGRPARPRRGGKRPAAGKAAGVPGAEKAAAGEKAVSDRAPAGRAAGVGQAVQPAGDPPRPKGEGEGSGPAALYRAADKLPGLTARRTAEETDRPSGAAERTAPAVLHRTAGNAAYRPVPATLAGARELWRQAGLSLGPAAGVWIQKEFSGLSVLFPGEIPGGEGSGARWERRAADRLPSLTARLAAAGEKAASGGALAGQTAGTGQAVLPAGDFPRPSGAAGNAAHRPVPAALAGARELWRQAARTLGAAAAGKPAQPPGAAALLPDGVPGGEPLFGRTVPDGRIGLRLRQPLAGLEAGEGAVRREKGRKGGGAAVQAASPAGLGSPTAGNTGPATIRRAEERSRPAAGGSAPLTGRGKSVETAGRTAERAAAAALWQIPVFQTVAPAFVLRHQALWRRQGWALAETGGGGTPPALGSAAEAGYRPLLRGERLRPAAPWSLERGPALAAERIPAALPDRETAFPPRPWRRGRGGRQNSPGAAFNGTSGAAGVIFRQADAGRETAASATERETRTVLQSQGAAGRPAVPSPLRMGPKTAGIHRAERSRGKGPAAVPALRRTARELLRGVFTAAGGGSKGWHAIPAVKQWEGPQTALRFARQVFRLQAPLPGQLPAPPAAPGGGGEERLLFAGETAAPAEGVRDRRQERTAARRAEVVYRQPQRQESQPPAAGQGGELEGEDVLKAQSVSPSRVAAMNAAYSYDARQGRSERAAAETLSREQEEQIVRRVLEDFNYNRMAAEVLDRVERRLRTERRKVGR